ncbi:glycosyltransferase family 1 protein [Cetobacterium sp.]|uniref:glycosyltransferase family 4 protein n=1 Tax=Cetobacterium sp. TaxID=2071632 RepID=UPI0025BF55FF|nr:glycosyltransferase family 1 protein [Cetobacterium sp.]
MKICFYATILKNKATGINNLIVNLINELSKNEHIDLIILGNKKINKEVLLKLQNVKRLNIIIDKNINVLTGGIYINKLYQKHKFDYIFGVAGILPPFINKEINKILYIHDFVYKEFPGTMSFKVKLIMKVLGDYSIKKANILWTNSNYTLSLVKKYFDITGKDVYVGASIDEVLYKKLDLSLENINKIKERYGILNNKKVLLFVGTLEPRKNLDFLISLMPDLEKLKYQLIVVGGKGWGNTRIKDQIKNLNLSSESIKFLNYISDDELLELYNVVDIYISTSLNEGFGLPQLEAMYCGVSVVSAENSAMIEVVKNGGKLISGWDKNKWIYEIEEVYKQRHMYSMLALKKSKLYNWKEIVKKFIEKIEGK